MMKKYDALIFDLDGTLWNAIAGVTEGWKAVFAKYQLPISIEEKDIASIMGLTVEEIAKKFFPTFNGIEIIKECCKVELDYLNIHNVYFYPQLKKTLHQLAKEYKLCIVSNCMAGYIEKFLEIGKLEKYFCDFENSERTGLSKKENILLVKKRNHFQNVLYIGDTIRDYEAAKSANVDYVQALYGFGDKIAHTTGIKRFSALLAYLNQ